jgi:acyl carrier protein
MEKLKSDIAAIISDVAEIPVGQVTEHASLGELGVDSLDALRIIAAIEKKYHVEVPEEMIGEVRSLSDIANMVAASV